MLEIKITGEDAEDVKGQLSNLLAILGGEGAAPAAGGSSKRKSTTKPDEKPKEVTFEMIEEALLSSTAPKADKKSLLADFNSAKISELDKDEYAPFYAKLIALV